MYGGKAEVFYSDGMPTGKEVCKNEGFMPETSQPGVPQNNSIIERTSQDVKYGTCALLAQAGNARLFVGICCTMLLYA